MRSIIHTSGGKNGKALQRSNQTGRIRLQSDKKQGETIMEMPQNIRVIPPNRHIGTQKRTAAVQKSRVAVYARISTESEEQETSFEMQVLHYTALIKNDPRWSFAGVYADDGISGTNT